MKPKTIMKNHSALSLFLFKLAFSVFWIVIPVSGGHAALVGQWNFNEDTGTTSADVSGNGNAAVFQNGMDWTSGERVDDYAASFGGTDEFIDYGSSSIFNLISNFSIAVWVKPIAGSGEQLIFGKDYSSWALSYFQSGDLYFYAGGRGFSASAPSGEWSFVVATFDTGLGVIYVNGAIASFANLGSTVPDNAGISVTSGANLYLTNYFQGALSQAQLYNTTLNLADVQSLYLSGPVVAVPEPSVILLLAIGVIVIPVWRRASTIWTLS